MALPIGRGWSTTRADRDCVDSGTCGLRVAFCGARALANIPVTPGGLGFVEAGLTGLLVLAGVDGGDAVLATFAYRLFSYWLPLPFGLLGFAIAPRSQPESATA